MLQSQVWQRLARTMTRPLALVGVLLCAAGCNRSSSPATAEVSASTDSDRKLCKQAILTFIDAHNMMYDGDGKVVQLSDQQAQKMKGLIRSGVVSAEKVSDTFLKSAHSDLRPQFRNNLVDGWKTYLNGLETKNPTEQVDGIEHLLRWDEYKQANATRLYEAIIK